MCFSSTVLDAAALIVRGESVRSHKELPQSVVRGMLGAWKALAGRHKSRTIGVAAMLLAGITDLKTHGQEPGVIRFTIPKLARSVAQVIEAATGQPAHGTSERSIARHLRTLRTAGYLESTTLSFTPRGDAYSVTRWAGNALADWFRVQDRTHKNKDLRTTPLPNLADISEVPPKPIEAEERSAPAAPAPVDNQESQQSKLAERPSPGRELHMIACETGMSKGQLGAVLTLCKAQQCKLQDVYETVGSYLHTLSLRGGRAFMYLKSCLEQNPGRDWTWRRRHDAQKEQEAMRAERENRAFERFLGKLQRGEGCTVRSTRTGDPLVLRLRAEAPDFLIAMSEDGQIKGSMPVRMAFETFPELNGAT